MPVTNEPGEAAARIDPIDLFNVATGVIAYRWKDGETLIGDFALPQYKGMIAQEDARKVSDRYPPEGPVTPYSFVGTYHVETHTVVDPHTHAAGSGPASKPAPAAFATGELIVERMTHAHPEQDANAADPKQHFYGVYLVSWRLHLTDLGAEGLGYANGTMLEFTGIGLRQPNVLTDPAYDPDRDDDREAMLILGWSNNIYNRQWTADGTRLRAFGLRSDPISAG